MKLRIDLALPAGYRLQDVMAFHGRDAEGLAEQVSDSSLRKGVVLAGQPVVFDVRFEHGQAACTVDVDGRLSKATRTLAEEALASILALRIDPAPFVRFARRDPVLASLVRAHKGLRIVQSATIFEALTWAIIGQQINLSFAIALRRTFIQLGGRRHANGMWCYPEAGDVAGLPLEDLTSRKFSGAKAETLLRVSRMVADGELPLDREADLDTTRERLLAIKGIGPWTVNYALLRGWGYPDCSLHGDVAVRAALHRLLGTDERPSIAEAEAWLAERAPHRTMTAAHLWASLGD
ncbi:MAG: DNA-3-methyladenine glycosylase family protein [Telluria sp.]